jgi:hypothetical protein
MALEEGAHWYISTLYVSIFNFGNEAFFFAALFVRSTTHFNHPLTQIPPQSLRTISTFDMPMSHGPHTSINLQSHKTYYLLI